MTIARWNVAFTWDLGSGVMAHVSMEVGSPEMQFQSVLDVVYWVRARFTETSIHSIEIERLPSRKHT